MHIGRYWCLSLWNKKGGGRNVEVLKKSEMLTRSKREKRKFLMSFGCRKKDNQKVSSAFWGLFVCRHSKAVCSNSFQMQTFHLLSMLSVACVVRFLLLRVDIIAFGGGELQTSMKMHQALLISLEFVKRIGPSLMKKWRPFSSWDKQKKSWSQGIILP